MKRALRDLAPLLIAVGLIALGYFVYALVRADVPQGEGHQLPRYEHIGKKEVLAIPSVLATPTET